MHEGRQAQENPQPEIEHEGHELQIKHERSRSGSRGVPGSRLGSGSSVRSVPFLQAMPLSAGGEVGYHWYIVHTHANRFCLLD